MQCATNREELSRLAAGELEPEREAELRSHVAGCADCARALTALRRIGRELRLMPRPEPPARLLMETRRLIAEELGGGAPEIMTLEEVAEFLRLPLEALDELVAELPAFDVAGFVRVRRQRLMEWLRERERGYLRARAQSEAARTMAGRT
ncbi:MAG: helix-turn-helix domain-containing protein [Candidatus Brocadiia bacterium]